ncbi:AFG1 family ATPase [Pseudoxanthomonas sp. CAU 1598]|uniref:Cell division protein ZapE n=1 Tax=Pseudomarimonas arenosa TaxID=2774145 RepID=A0AAW3ZNU6_9GAMM|nr:AFG1 family ATPase [Pseudomarimonas arenosa]
MAPSKAYNEGVANGRWQDDPAQRQVLLHFDRIHTELSVQQGGGLWRSLQRRLTPNDPVNGLYLWGGVGRGKTFLVDLFFEHLPIERKRRVHFHRFMGDVHARLLTLAGRSDPLADVADDIAGECALLCLDEFFVSDIGDAMILGRLLFKLFERRVVLVTTSNTMPDQLYKDGLQRTRFLPAIDQIKQHCVVHYMESSQDYRLRTLTQAPVYHWPLNGQAEIALEQFYEKLTQDTVREGEPLHINGRPIPAIDYSEGVAWFDFHALCDGPRAVADYIEIARDFHTVLLAHVPQFDATRDNAAKRFIHLVDEFYDRSVNLIVSAEVALTDLYRGEKLSAEFSRTESRLIEMQSEDYLARAHRP